MSSAKDRIDTAQDWGEALARGKAQIEAGKTVPLEPVLERLRASAARMEDRQAKRAARKA